MKKSFVKMITQEPAKAVNLIEQKLGKKLLETIRRETQIVAREAYGPLNSCYGADDHPAFMNQDDNTYAVFYANALKKFGVQGPQDFRDDATKNAFFNYVDHNWKAQDAVQAQPQPQQAIGATGMENGTQTQLPAPAMQPKAPQTPGAGIQADQGVSPSDPNDPSVAGMAPVSPTDDNNEPLGNAGDDAALDMQQAKGQAPNMGDPNMAGGQDPSMGDPALQGDDMDQDPDLEIGDNDQADPNGMGQFGQDPEDEQGLGGDPSMQGGDMGDEMDDPSNGQQEQPIGANGSNEFDDFDDAYSIDPADFESVGGDPSGGMGDPNGFGNDNGADDGSGDGSDDDDQFGQGNADDSGDDSDSDFGGDDDGSQDDDGSGDDDDSDPDLDISDDDDDSGSAPPKKSPFGKSAPSKKPSFGGGKPSGGKPSFGGKKKSSSFGEEMQMMENDQLLDEAFLDNLQERVDPRTFNAAAGHLKNVKRQRNVSMQRLKAIHSRIKKDPNMHPDHKTAAIERLKKLAQMNRQHHGEMAHGIKAAFTGKGL